MDPIRDALMEKYCLQLCYYEMAKYEGRQTRLNGPMQKYFNSTQTKNAFARLMHIAAKVKSLYTKTNIATELHITRQAAHQMVDECLDAGWIEVDQAGRCPTYKATQTLQDGLMKYAKFALETGQGIGVVHYRQALSNYDEAERKVSLHCQGNPTEAELQSDTDQKNKEQSNVTNFKSNLRKLHESRGR
tara:strand:- start:6 stop:572 length:567 start_codon:yes stop_codon:yes gene_type:complete